MTGQLVFRGKEVFGAGHPNDSLIGELPDRSTRVTIDFSDDSRLYFNDQRKFGWMRLMPTVEIPNIDFMKKVGPEPLATDFTANVFIERVQRRKNTTIKAAILDQTVLAGVGNIYADESLFAAGIHPASTVSAIPKTKLKQLHAEIIAVLRLSIEKGGSTDRNYVNAEGKRGSYIDFAKVFRRDTLPCPVCGHEIIKTKVAGRGTHVCTTCQKLYKRK
jgi:formamidopyrimidine-DNA glycosylase